MPTATNVLIGIGLATALFGAIAYAYGFVLKPKGFRPLNIIALCGAVISMVQMTIALQNPTTGRVNLMYALGLAAFSLTAQGIMAVQGRHRGVRSDAGDRRAAS